MNDLTRRALCALSGGIVAATLAGAALFLAGYPVAWPMVLWAWCCGALAGAFVPPRL